jgi:hypothetical protein
MASAISTISSTGAKAGGTTTGTVIVALSHSTQVTQAGRYKVAVYGSIGSGVGVNDAENISLVIGSSTVVLPVAAVAGGFGPYYFDVTLDGSTDVSAVVGALTSVGAYDVMLTADYKGSIGGLR